VRIFLQAEQEPILSSFLYASILAHDCLERSVAFVLANRLKNVTLLATQLMDVFDDVMARPDFREDIRADLQVSAAWHQPGTSLAPAWHLPGTSLAQGWHPRTGPVLTQQQAYSPLLIPHSGANLGFHFLKAPHPSDRVSTGCLPVTGDRRCGIETPPAAPTATPSSTTRYTPGVPQSCFPSFWLASMCTPPGAFTVHRARPVYRAEPCIAQLTPRPLLSYFSRRVLILCRVYLLLGVSVFCSLLQGFHALQSYPHRPCSLEPWPAHPGPGPAVADQRGEHELTAEGKPGKKKRGLGACETLYPSSTHIPSDTLGP